MLSKLLIFLIKVGNVMSKMYFRELVLSTPWLKKLYLKRRSQTTNDLMTSSQLQIYLDEAEKVFLKYPTHVKVGLVKDDNNYADVGLIKERAYFPRSEERRVGKE